MRSIYLLPVAEAARQFHFYLYPRQFERDGILSLWYSELYRELERHPLRSLDAKEASVFFLGIDVSCAYLYPVYAPPAPGSENYVQEGRWGPLGDARQCRDSRKARLEAYVRNGWAPYWGVEGKQHIVFDQLCHHPPMQIVQGQHFVSLAGVGHLKAKAYAYRPGIDISWPEMPVTVEDKGSGDCRPRKRLVSFQGAGTRGVRSELQKLHNGEDVVVNVVDVSRSSLNTTDARWNVSHPIKAPFAELLRESDFALAPAGHSPCSLRLYEVMSFGSVPVVLADEKLLPFSEILNWSELVVLVPENAADTVLPRLRGIAADIRCQMRRKGHEAFEKYFATVSGNVRGLMEVLERHWRRGFGPTEESEKLAKEFAEHSLALSWSPLAQQDFHMSRTYLEHVRYAGDLDKDGDCKISWQELLAHAQEAHAAGRAALATWAATEADEDEHLELVVTAAYRQNLQMDSKWDLSQLDFNNDTPVALRELLWGSLHWEMRREALEAGFHAADSDSDGLLSDAELQRPMAQRLLRLVTHGLPSEKASPCSHAQDFASCGFLHLPGILGISKEMREANCSASLDDAWRSLAPGLEVLLKVPTGGHSYELLASRLLCAPEDLRDNSEQQPEGRYTALLALETLTSPLHLVTRSAPGCGFRESYVAGYLAPGSVILLDARRVAVEGRRTVGPWRIARFDLDRLGETSKAASSEL